MAARDWREKGAPRFSYLPDRATLRQYRGVAARCRHEEGDASAVQGYLTAARRRGWMWVGLLVVPVLIAILIGGFVGANNWRTQNGVSWNAVYLWGRLRVGLYEGPPMVPVTAGCFDMGCVGENPECTDAEKPVRPVCLEAFDMGVSEVTQDQWAAVMGRNPSYFKAGDGRLPVEQVSWYEAWEFIRRLNSLTGKQYRLPTEAEWEYAARSGGKMETYAGGENLEDLGWYGENSEKKTHPVKQKDPNGLWLYDMSGNVWEWVEDDWHKDYEDRPKDGSAWVNDPRAAYRVIRGGGWGFDARDCRSAARYGLAPDNRGGGIGFRLARSVALGP
jgi:formylglycine-generating enzyme required for sulfatase activity